MKITFETLDFQPCPDGETPDRFSFECPRKAGVMCDGLLIRHKELKAAHPSWEWNGKRDKPTFTPSINCGRCGAHGFITDGNWRNA